MFFKYACLLRFGRGVLKPCQHFVGLNQSMLNGFCDGSKDFLKLSRLLSHKHSIDHSQNAQECLDHVHAIRGTFGPLSRIGPEHYNRFCGPCVGATGNENLSAPQKELLKWLWKLGISMYRIQEMMCERHYEEPNGNKTIFPAIIKPKLVSARNCIVPPCQSCLLARARKRTPNVSRTRLLDNREGAITRDQYNVGDFVSPDQFICKTPGRLPTRYGQESQDCRFQGGTIYNDAASGLIWVENQVSLGANETVMGKACFEQWLDDE